MADSEKSPQGRVTEETEGSLLDQIMQETRLKPSDEGYGIAKRGVEAFISELLAPQRGKGKGRQGIGGPD